jgi:hypothetical protein
VSWNSKTQELLDGDKPLIDLPLPPRNWDNFIQYSVSENDAKIARRYAAKVSARLVEYGAHSVTIEDTIQ